MKVKIASLVPYKIIPPVTGGQKGIFLFLKYLGAYADVSCITVSENREHLPGVEFHTVLGSTSAKTRYIDFLLFRKIKHICKEKKIQYLIIEHPYYAWLGYLLKKRAGVRLIIHSHNIEALRFRSMNTWWWKMMYRYEKFAHTNADLNFFISEEDQKFAIKSYLLDAAKCAVITDGTEATHAPSAEEKRNSREEICKELNIPVHTRLILFNGTLSYPPNRQALDRILNEINPVLLREEHLAYKIIICGMGLPASYNNLAKYHHHNIIYKGFVTDIDVYFKGVDLFINPITDGGGIKTKLVEALAANTPSVSFKAGAYGVPLTVTGSSLAVVPGNDCKAFAEAVIMQLNRQAQPIPSAFFDHFSWDAIARKAVKMIQQIV